MPPTLTLYSTTSFSLLAGLAFSLLQNCPVVFQSFQPPPPPPLPLYEEKKREKKEGKEKRRKAWIPKHRHLNSFSFIPFFNARFFARLFIQLFKQRIAFPRFNIETSIRYFLWRTFRLCPFAILHTISRRRFLACCFSNKPERYPFSRGNFDSSLTIAQTACPVCVCRASFWTFSNSSLDRKADRDDPSLSLSCLSFFLFSFHFLSRQRIRKGYCRLNPVVADVVGVAVVGPFVAVHPEMSVIWTAMLGSRQ